MSLICTGCNRCTAFVFCFSRSQIEVTPRCGITLLPRCIMFVHLCHGAGSGYIHQSIYPSIHFLQNGSTDSDGVFNVLIFCSLPHAEQTSSLLSAASCMQPYFCLRSARHVHELFQTVTSTLIDEPFLKKKLCILRQNTEIVLLCIKDVQILSVCLSLRSFSPPRSFKFFNVFPDKMSLPLTESNLDQMAQKAEEVSRQPRKH